MRRQHEVANELFRPAQNNNYNETHNVQRDAAVPLVNIYCTSNVLLLGLVD